MDVSKGHIFEEVKDVVHLWNHRRWKRRFISLRPGRLDVFLSDEKVKAQSQKTVRLQGCAVEEAGSLKSENPHPEKRSSRLQLWIKFRRSISFDDKLQQGAILTIVPLKGKKLMILVPKEEVTKWKAAIEKAASLEVSAQHEANTLKSPDGSSSRKRTTSEKSSSTIVPRRNLQPPGPWSLKWDVTNGGQHTANNVISDSKSEISENDGHRTSSTSNKPEPLWSDMETFQGCTDFLRSNCFNAQALAHVALMIDHFKGCYQMGDSSLPDELRLEAWRGTLRRLTKTLVENLLDENPALESCQLHQEHMDKLWVACEVWIAGAVYDKIMGACKQMFSVKDKQLDQILAKLDKVDPSVLGIRPEFKDFILGDALQRFRMINMYHTPLEKAVCLRKTIKLIVDGIERVAKLCSGGLAETDELHPCTDDLLSFMLLLMARAKVKYLQANACYMQRFLFLQEDDYQKGELGYHITNFVAACEYLFSADIQKLVAEVVETPAATLPRAKSSHGNGYESQVTSSTITYGTSSHCVKPLDWCHAQSADSRQQVYRISTSRNHLYCGSREGSEESPTYQANFIQGTKLNGSVQHHGLKEQSHLVSLGGDDIGSPKWIRDNYQVKKEGIRTIPSCTTIRKQALALPGSSPEFILSPTYV